MARNAHRYVLLSAALLVIGGLHLNVGTAHGQEAACTAGCADASCCGSYSDSLRPDLFYNYYAGSNCGGTTAHMYPSPRPTPPVVGHTYYTYQPLYPHEHMYRHHRKYVRKYDGGKRRNVVDVYYYNTPFTRLFRLP